MSAVVTVASLWGVWCVELEAWCLGLDGGDKPQTFTSEQQAKDHAVWWKTENDDMVARRVRPARAGVHIPLIGDGCMIPLTYQARAYTSDPEEAPVTQRDPEPECTADLDHPCDAGGRDDNDDPIPCADCARYEREIRAEVLRERAMATVAQLDPERYRREMIDAGDGHKLGSA